MSQQKNKTTKAHVNDIPSAYELLGLMPHATQQEIADSWLILEKELSCHPEKKKIAKAAYDLLIDPMKRPLYGVITTLEELEVPSQNGSSFNISPETYKDPAAKELIKLVCHEPKKGDSTFVINITLQEAYKGKVIKFSVDRFVLCTSCPNSTGKIATKCTICLQKPLYSILQVCSVCKNQGVILQNCSVCNGSCTTRQNHLFTVNVESGAFDGQKIVFKNKGNMTKLNQQACDIIFTIHQEPDKDFSRQGSDLFTVKTLSLSDALFGRYFTIKHINGRTLKVDTSDVHITPGCSMMIRRYGMPLIGSGSHGNLIITFNVTMPLAKEMDFKKIDELRELIPGKEFKKPDDAEYCELVDYKRNVKLKKHPKVEVFDENIPGFRIFPRKEPSNCKVQ